MKYIDSEKFLAEVNQRMGEYDVQQLTSEHPDYEQGAQDALYNLKLQLSSLQQEQPNKYETALEKAREWMPNVNQGGHAMLIDIFPELGEVFDPRYGGRKQEHPEVELEEEIEEHAECMPMSEFTHEREAEEFTEWAKKEFHHFYQLGLNAKKK